MRTPPPLTHTYYEDDDNNVKGIIILRPPSPVKWIPKKPMPIEIKDPTISYDRLFNIEYPIQNEPGISNEELDNSKVPAIKSFLDVAEDFNQDEEKNDVLDNNRSVKKSISIPKSELKDDDDDNKNNDNQHMTVADNFKYTDKDELNNIPPPVADEVNNNIDNNQNNEIKEEEKKDEETKEEEKKKEKKEEKKKEKKKTETGEEEEEEEEEIKSKTCHLL